MKDLTPDDVTAILGALAALFVVLTAVGLLLVRRLVRAFESLTHVKVPPEIVNQLESFARIGANYAEEQSRKYILGLLPEGPRTPAQKLEVAVSTARTIAPGSLASFSDQQIAIAVEAQLPSIRPEIEQTVPPVAGSKSLVPLSMPVPGAPGIPSDLAPTTFLDTEVKTSPQTPSSKRGL